MATGTKIQKRQKYKLRISNSKKEPYSLGDNKKFTPPASKKDKPKVYTVSSNGKLHYVGITRQSMSARLRYGLSLKAMGKQRHGYHGYKLEPGNYILHVWSFDKSPQNKNEANEELETIEAEVVFLCRILTGQWPKSQNEIHFHQSESLHRELALTIYQNLQSRKLRMESGFNLGIQKGARKE